MNSFKSYMISTKVYLDNYNQCYKNIVVINLQPEGPLGKIVRKIHTPQLSPFNSISPCCKTKECSFALFSLNDVCFNGEKNGCLMCEDEIPNLFSFLLSNGYKIDTSLTKMMNQSEIKISNDKLLCFITYTG